MKVRALIIGLCATMLFANTVIAAPADSAAQRKWRMPAQPWLLIALGVNHPLPIVGAKSPDTRPGHISPGLSYRFGRGYISPLHTTLGLYRGFGITASLHEYSANVSSHFEQEVLKQFPEARVHYTSYYWQYDFFHLGIGISLSKRLRKRLFVDGELQYLSSDVSMPEVTIVAPGPNPLNDPQAKPLSLAIHDDYYSYGSHGVLLAAQLRYRAKYGPTGVLRLTFISIPNFAYSSSKYDSRMSDPSWSDDRRISFNTLLISAGLGLTINAPKITWKEEYYR